MKIQPLIVVHDVQKSSLWYQDVFSFTSAHGGAEYERLSFDGELILQLHKWDAHEHQHLGDASKKPYGNGVLLWFVVDDFDATVARAKALDAHILEEPFVNKNANQRECWLRDISDYTVVIAGRPGDI